MFNSQMPNLEDLPTTGQLRRATAFALAASGLILVTIVLPSEYAIDPTGIGRQLGLTQMGEIKAQLSEEAARDAAGGVEATPTAIAAIASPAPASTATADHAGVAADTPAAVATGRPAASASVASAATEPVKKAVTPPIVADRKSDVTTLTLGPGQAAEIKATMAKGAMIAFAWSVEGGLVNFDTHADAPGIDYHGYGKGKDSAGDKGELVAAFDGKHGWFWRNRSEGPVTITLRTDGAYTDLRRAL